MRGPYSKPSAALLAVIACASLSSCDRSTSGMAEVSGDVDFIEVECFFWCLIKQWDSDGPVSINRDTSSVVSKEGIFK